MSDKTESNRKIEAAPIAFFAYRRPGHTSRALESLLRNPLAAQSTLFAFCDGPRDDSDRNDVRETREIIRRFQWPGRREIVEHENNIGLAGSIIRGVDSVMLRHDRVIVIEDDIVVAPDFLAYMSGALDFYANDATVACISGFGPRLTPPAEESADGYFLRRISTWGWGTWRRAWGLLERDWIALRRVLRHDPPCWDEIGWDLKRFVDTPEGDAVGQKIWSPMWLFPAYRAKSSTLWPYRSRVSNIGHDGSGTNSSNECRYVSEADALPAGASREFRYPETSSPNADAMRRFVALVGPRPSVQSPLLLFARKVLGMLPGTRPAYRATRALLGRVMGRRGDERAQP